jgi:hypothetical protein
LEIFRLSICPLPFGTGRDWKIMKSLIEWRRLVVNVLDSLVRTSWVRHPSRTTLDTPLCFIAAFFEWDVNPRFLVPVFLCMQGKQRIPQRGKGVTCCRFPFFNIAELRITGPQWHEIKTAAIRKRLTLERTHKEKTKKTKSLIEVYPTFERTCPCVG